LLFVPDPEDVPGVPTLREYVDERAGTGGIGVGVCNGPEHEGDGVGNCPSILLDNRPGV
jgi:hypothetical protein